MSVNHSGRKISEEALLSRHAWREIGRSLGLSARELQIVRGIFADETEAGIGANLKISSHTVHTYMERLHRKLGVVDRVDLVLKVTREFLRLTTSPESGLPAICARRAAGECPLEQ